MNSKTIGIVTRSKTAFGHRKWDPDVIYHGISGAEESIIYMANALALLGVSVIVYADPPAGSKYSLPASNPRYLDETCFQDTHLDAAIAFCLPEIAEQLKPFADRVYLWHHGYINQMESDAILAWDGILWLSEFQKNWHVERYPALQRYQGVFGNGIDIDRFPPIVERENPYSCVYASHYERGLSHLLDFWPHLKQAFPRATLDIYYGYSGDQPVTPETELSLKIKIPQLFLSDVREHGRVGQDELNHALNRASFWIHPSVYPESFCITALRAQYAGAIPVVYRWGALAETVQHGYFCSEYTHLPDPLLLALSQAPAISLSDRAAMRHFIREKYTWEKAARRWLACFEIRSV
jgi:glycosyltransferase involved in cell wall biosynthesis